MRETRRGFVIALTGAAGCVSIPPLALMGQRPITPPPPPAPAETQPNPVSAAPGADAARRALLLRNEREFRAGVEDLYRLSSALRDEVQKTATRDGFSVHIYKETEAIEKLAKRLKNKITA